MPHPAFESGKLVWLIAGRSKSIRCLACPTITTRNNNLFKWYSGNSLRRELNRLKQCASWIRQLTLTKIFGSLTEKYPAGSALSPSEWKRFIFPLGYLPLPRLQEGMDCFVSETRMVLPISEMDDERVKCVEYNFDHHWAMFVDWIA